MNEADIKAIVLEALGDVAPEADLKSLAGGDDLRETLDLDSMDFLNFITRLHQRTGRDIPEADCPKLFTLDGAIAYLRR